MLDMPRRIVLLVNNTDRLYGNFEIPKTEALIKKWCIDYLKNRPETTEIELE
jgi:hypothetical protein